MNAVALCSGGLDSTVSLSVAIKRNLKVSLVLFFDYGQKATRNELRSVSKICRHYSLKLKVICLPFLREITKTALVNKASRVPRFTQINLDSKRHTQAGARDVWVPNRNALFINIAAGFCDAFKIDRIITGFDREEAATFPDNSDRFVSAINQSLSYSTIYKPQVISFTSDMNKTEIVTTGLRLGAPLRYTWSCYLSGKTPCLTCESCQRAKRAYLFNGIIYEYFIA